MPLYVILSRLQFALTTLFHITWPVLTIGLGLFLVFLEVLWIRFGDDDHYRHARFWSRLFLLNFSVGVVTGLPLEFEFGTNWAPFSAATGGFFGNMLGFEGAMAFMLEAGFLGIMMFGWHRVPRVIHLIATCMVAFGASISAFWIMVANSWMQTPAGGHMVGGRFVVTDYLAAIFNPDMPWGVSHMWVACLEVGLFVVGGISAWYILRGQHAAFFMKSFRLAIVLAIVVTPLQIWLGDSSGKLVFRDQPAKGAAIEGDWTTNPPGEGAPWAVVGWPDAAKQRNDWAITVPDLLSVLATDTLTGRVIGLGSIPRDDQPPLLPLIFYAFRVMAGIGILLFLLMLASVIAWSRGWLGPVPGRAARWLLMAWVAAIPLGYIATCCGWIVREVGRQPWIIYGVMRTVQGASRVPAASVGYTLAGFLTIYAVLLTAFLAFAARIIARGPDMAVRVPSRAPLHQEREGGRLSAA